MFAIPIENSNEVKPNPSKQNTIIISNKHITCYLSCINELELVTWINSLVRAIVPVARVKLNPIVNNSVVMERIPAFKALNLGFNKF